MDDAALFTKFRTISKLLRPRGGRGRPGPAPEGGWGPAADPTRGQGRILAALKLQDGVPTKDLAFILGMRVASLNELLGKLEKAELITREPAADDRRVMLIRLTEAGREAPQHRPDRPDAFSTLSDDEREQLGGLLDRIIDQLESQLPAATPDAEFASWSEQVRARMGDERFERWMQRMAEYEPEHFPRPGRGGRPPHGERCGHGERHHHRHGHGHGRRHGHGHSRGRRRDHWAV